MADRVHIVVHPVSPIGGRRVTAHIHGEDLTMGIAHGMDDLVEFLRRAGLHADGTELANAEFVDWLRDGPEVWTNPPPL
ncbi:hypothetical protein ACWGI8_05910 [Streptomyces sp. NPDC054841]